MTAAERQAEIAAWVSQPTRFRLSDALRFAAWQLMEEIPGYTSADFGDDCAALGMHRQGARNRYNEALASIVDNGLRGA
jgi:hypothetical protein